MRKQTAVVEILLLKMVLKKYEIHVKSIEDFNENIRIVKFRFDISSFDILPGGFVMLWKEGYLDERGILIKRAYSVASSVENKNYLEICFKIEEIGRFSKIVKELKKGDKLNMQGPFNGHFILKKEHDPYFVVAGTGIAPIMSMLRSNDKLETTLIYGIKTDKDYIYKKRLESFQKIKKIICVSRQDDTSYNKGRITKQILKDNLTNTYKDVFICGPNEMITQTIKNLKELGFNKIHVDKWS